MYKNIMDYLFNNNSWTLNDFFLSLLYDSYIVSPIIASLILLFLILFFWQKHVKRSRRLLKYRKKIPLVIGGWGSRGKSGTERLKAAVFNGLGLSVFSKTTGCEAMFVFNPPSKALQDVPLYRPNGKATIWEQQDVLNIAYHLGCDVFLWECMALREEYVRILQEDWMKDDISTITNTYPDHEDVQGPAGFQIPLTMQAFVPKTVNLYTTEELMLPILKDASKNKNSKIIPIPKEDTFLITPDALKIFPYEEHPANIELVLKTVEEMGVSRNFALYHMSSFVIADIGVLRIYPRSSYQKRTFEFSNGFSANERYGCLSNWKRLGLEKIKENIWLSVLINNRYDRVARSQIFAHIVAEDLSADLFYVVGSNKKGYVSFLKNYLEIWISNQKISESSSLEEWLTLLKKLYSRIRYPISLNILKERISSILCDEKYTYIISSMNHENIDLFLKSLNDSNIEKDVLFFVEKEIKHYFLFVESCETFKKNKEQGWNKESQLFLKRFMDKVIIVDDIIQYSGDKMLRLFLKDTPPHLLNMMHGIQNIKGPGLALMEALESWRVFYENMIKNFPLEYKKQVEEVLDSKNILFDEYLHLCPFYKNSNQENNEHKKEHKKYSLFKKKSEFLWQPFYMIIQKHKTWNLYMKLTKRKITVKECIHNLRKYM